jgi:DNA-binding Lrp family transcriptional regulator
VTVTSQRKHQSQEVIARRVRVAELWARRITQREMARVLGVSEPTISRDVAALTAEWRKEAQAYLDDVKAHELADLDSMERDVAVEYTQTHNLRLIDVRLRIKDRRARLLGLDAPTRVDATISDDVDIYTDPEAVRAHLTALIDRAADRRANARAAGPTPS